jgi:hypothetical protein
MLQINSIQPDLFSPEEVESKRRVVLFRVKKVPSCRVLGPSVTNSASTLINPIQFDLFSADEMSGQGAPLYRVFERTRGFVWLTENVTYLRILGFDVVATDRKNMSGQPNGSLYVFKTLTGPRCSSG